MHSFKESSYTDDQGTTTHRESREPGKQPVTEHFHVPTSGRVEYKSGPAQTDKRIEGSRIQDVTDEEQAKRDREYEERIEDEYAKREGGA
jgi:hypothetical protein